MTKARGVGSASTRERIARTAKVLAAITESGQAGIATAALEDVAGVSRDALARHLSRLRREGLVSCIKASSRTRYVLVLHAETARAQRDSVSVERRNQRAKVRQTAQRRAREVAAIAKVLTVRQRIVCAATAPALQVCGPSSVFDLGAW